MLLKNIALAATTIFGLAAADCTITGYDDTACKVKPGSSRIIKSNAVCVELGGRNSYKLSSDCKSVRVSTRTGHSCGGSEFNLNDLTAGCHTNNPSKILSATFQLR